MEKFIMKIHSLKNLGTNYNITDNPLFHMETLETQFISRDLGTNTPSRYYTNWKHLGFFLSIFHYMNLYACFKQIVYLKNEIV